MKFFNAFKSKFFSIFIALSFLITAFGIGIYIFETRAEATTQIQSIIGIKKVGDPTYVTHLNNLHAGDKIRVQLAAINGTSGNTINNLQFYSAFAKDGVFGWVKADGMAKVGGVNLTYDLPSGYTVEYIPGSTYYETNATGSFVGGYEADNSHNESLLFVNDSHPGVGYHKTNLAGNPAPYKYIAYYDLKVVPDIKPVFNELPGDQPTFQVRKVGDSSFHTSVSGVNAGDELEFKIYVHNNKRGSVALNTKVGVDNCPGNTKANNYSISGFVKADNADKKASSVTLSSGNSFSLDYIEGSTRIQGWPTVLGPIYDSNATRPDGVITVNGIQIGDQGKVDGCWDFIQTVWFKARVEAVTVTPTPTPTSTPTPTPTATPTAPPAGPTSSCSALTASTTSGTKPLTVNFTGSGSDSAGSIQGYQFNFGDNSNGQDQIVTTTNNQVSHVYHNAGTYTANLIVKDSRGVWVGGGNCQVNINVNNPPQVLGATSPPSLPKTGANDLWIAIAAPLLIGSGIYIFRKFRLI